METMTTEARVLRLTRLLLRVPEAAEVLSISKSKCYELVAAGRLPSLKVGASIRVPLAALEEWIAESLECER